MARQQAEPIIETSLLATSVAKVWRMVAGAIEPNPGEEDPMASGFEAASKFAVVVFGDAGQEEVSVSANDLATMMSKAFCRTEGREALPLADMPPRARVAWQAVARHAANLLELDPNDTGLIPEAEEKMLSWAAGQLARLMR